MIGSRLVWALGSIGVLTVALHCGSAAESTFSAPNDSPCGTLYKDLCGKPCASDSDCASGLYCGANGTCTADCAPGYACPGSLLCSGRGRCSGDLGGFRDGGDPGDGAAASEVICADVDVALTKLLPKVLFLLDQSSSMYVFKFPSGDSQDCQQGCRWSVLKDVLIGPPNNPGGLLKQLEGEAEIAVELYSATDSEPNDGDNSYLPDASTSPVCPRFNGKPFDGLSFAANAYAGVEAMLRPATVDDDTPTGPAIRKVVGLADDGGVVDDAGYAAVASKAPKVIVLVTDGEPGLCGENFPSDPGRAAVVSAVQQTYKQQIRTFVIAIGDTTADAQKHFNAVANAGQGLDPATGDAGAIRPSTQQQLVDALRRIVLDARSCSFDLNGQVEPGMERLGRVTLNGAVVPFDEPGGAEEGWRLVNPSRIELVGGACTTLKGTPDAQLTARFPCGAVTTVPK